MDAPAPSGFAMVGDSQPKGKGRSKKGKQWQTLDLATVAPNSFGTSPQAVSRPSRGAGNSNEASHTKGRQDGKGGSGQSDRGDRRHPVRGQNPGLPIDMNGLSRGVNSMSIGGLRTLPAQAAS